MSAGFMNWKNQQYGSGSGSHGTVTFSSDTLDIALIDTGTTDPAIATHQDWADLSSALVGTATTIGTPTFGGSSPNIDMDASDTTISAVSGASAEELVLMKDSGTASTSILIWQWDSGDVSGLPVTPNGGDITVVWNASGILRF
jgi:hypothetical protein